ncbi:MAG: ribosomal protein S18-alanine N-acetyltransferase [Clostridia bacterium]|nr:ribosomal protein S18-alanine N-acetyltransferase [Clostridia bacterium]
MTVNDLRIQRMGISEVATIAKMERCGFTTPWREEELKESLSDEVTVFWVALLEDKIVGYISRTHSFETMDILTLYVLKEFRRNGIAAKLLAYLEQEARQKGVEKIFLEVRESNTAARKLYENNGYILIHKRARYYNNPTEDALILQKEIG